MLIALFIFEVLLTGLTILTTCMVENKFKYIEQSLKMYTNNKAYTTEERIAFIEGIVKRYKECMEDSDEMPDIDSIVKNHLSKEYIGRFPYISVKNIATKIKRLMWGVIILEVLITIINGQGATLPIVIMVSASVLLTMGMEFYTIIRGLNERNENLIAEINDYVINIYPIKKKKVRDIKEVKIMGNKVITLDSKGNRKETQLTSQQEEQLKNYKQELKLEESKKKKESTKESAKEVTLNAQDIAQLLGIL